MFLFKNTSIFTAPFTKQQQINGKVKSIRRNEVRKTPSYRF